MQRFSLLLLTLTGILCVPTGAALASPPKALLVLNLTSATAPETANAVHFFVEPDPSLVQLLESAPKELTADQLQGLVGGLAAAKPSEDRWISAKGDEILVYVFYDLEKGEPAIEIVEKPRRTRLAGDLAKLAELAKEVVFAAEIKYGKAVRHYSLTRERAVLTVTASQKPEGGDSVSAAAAIITGPREHAFLAVDLPITRTSQAKYNASTGSLEPKEAPSKFHISINYTLGDVLSSRYESLWEGLVLKGLCEATKKPLDSYGVGIGYRAPNISLLGFKLDAFSPFVAFLWIREDEVNEAGAPETDKAYKTAVRAGLSFNLDRGLAWLKGE